MTLTDLQDCAGLSPYARFRIPAFRNPERRSVASYERELSAQMDVEFQLRAVLARDAALLRQKDTLIKQQAHDHLEAIQESMIGLFAQKLPTAKSRRTFAHASD